MLPDARHFCDRTLSVPGTEAPALRSFSMTSAAAGTSGLTPEQISAIDAAHLWHPYSTIGAEAPGSHSSATEKKSTHSTR
jgi:hypothetical protein